MAGRRKSPCHRHASEVFPRPDEQGIGVAPERLKTISSPNLRSSSSDRGRLVVSGGGRERAVCLRAWPCLYAGHRDCAAFLDQIGAQLLRRWHLLCPRITVGQQSRRGMHGEICRRNSMELIPSHRERHRHARPQARAVGRNHRRTTGSGRIDEHLASPVFPDVCRNRRSTLGGGKGPVTRAFYPSGRPDSNRRPSPWQKSSTYSPICENARKLRLTKAFSRCCFRAVARCFAASRGLAAA